MKTVLKNPWVRFVALLVLVYLGFCIVRTIRGVLIPFSLALVAAYIFDPVVDWLETIKVRGLRLNRVAAVIVLLCVLIGIVTLFAAIAVPNAISSLGEVLKGENLDKIIHFLPDNVREVVEDLRAAGPEKQKEIVTGLLGDLFQSENTVSAVGESARTVALSALSTMLWVFNFFLFFVVTVYLLLDIDRARDRVKDALPLKYQDEIIRISSRLDGNLKAFFRGQCAVVGVLTLIFTVGLWIIDCPFWYFVGIAGGIGAFIPYFALASGMVPAMILMFARHGEPWAPLAAAAVFGIGLAVDNVLVTPNIIGKSVGLHPVVIILSILIFGTLLGFLGVIFAVPIAAVVKVLVEELFARYKHSELYTGPTEGCAQEQ